MTQAKVFLIMALAFCGIGGTVTLLSLPVNCTKEITPFSSSCFFRWLESLFSLHSSMRGGRNGVSVTAFSSRRKFRYRSAARSKA